MLLNRQFILNVSCPDAPGIVAAVATFVADRSASILDSQQYGDEDTGRFFLRIRFVDVSGSLSEHELAQAFDVVAEKLRLRYSICRADHKDRLLVMVSKQGHCLNDLLHRVQIGAMRASIEAVVSNHETLKGIVEWYGIPFYYVPVTPETKGRAEDELRAIIAEHRVDTVVLARYMQILSDGLCRELDGRVINIHHSLLPSFKGARPYHQAYDRGVKVVGATAHYVTGDLDEGPIIEQDFERVTHGMGPQELTALGRDLEARALARSVTAHVERRVMLNGRKTVVF